ncbi:MAG: SIMPL domain-containing protein [Erysipelotrichaceae bacterium]|nr:SIMPL domain-containing protein [Erysipelotrichaceae bacterium]
MERTIRVNGKGSLKVAPDMLRVSIHQSEVRKTYDEAYSASSVSKAEINKAFEELGIDSKLLKTSYLNINEERVSYKKNDQYLTKKVGYRYNHEMFILLDLDHEMLAKVFDRLSKLECTPEINLSSTLKDPESSKNELIGNAVKDSKIKAEVLCEALGVKLGEVKEINYSWGRLEIYEDCAVEAKMMCTGKGMDMSFDDINLEDTVTVVWTIE